MRKYITVIVTPEMAKSFLETMGTNRKINKNRVETYKRDLENGTFQNCVNPICFYEDGRLFDGQHRLEAIVESGISTDLTICYDNPIGTTTDTGLTRSLSDILTMRGNVSDKFSKKGYTSLVNQYIAIKLKSAKSKTITTSEREAFILNNEHAIDLAIQASKKGAGHPICDKAGVHVALFAAIISGVSSETLSDFCYHVNTGKNIDDSKSSALILRKFLDNSNNATRGASSINFCASTAEQAIRDYVAGKPRTQRYTKIDHVYVNANPNPDFTVHANGNVREEVAV